MLTPGSEAPDFTLTNQHGERIRLITLRGHPVLVYFYPRANTPGCTQQACGLRDIVDRIGDTVVLGISPDPPATQLSFDQRHHLGFALLSDPDHRVAEDYGVWQLKKLYGRASMGIVRSAFLIDAGGVIQQAWYKISPKDTPLRLLEALSG
jgi:peroxiredoxin Q/BCP